MRSWSYRVDKEQKRYSYSRISDKVKIQMCVCVSKRTHTLKAVAQEDTDRRRWNQREHTPTP